MIGMRCYSSAMTTLDKLMTRTATTDTGCMIFTGYKEKRMGYGYVRHEGKVRLAHRVAYSLAIGPIPEGLTIDHLCRQPSCINPDHLEAVTQGENNRRGTTYDFQRAKTTCPKGHPYSHTVVAKGYTERRCRECHRDAQRRYLARRAESS